MSAITTHILDIARGRPARDVRVILSYQGADGWQRIAYATTDRDGRAGQLLAEDYSLEAGTYRLRFDIGAYMERCGVETFYPYAEVVFQVGDPQEHYHVPLLLSPFGYSTYRGS